MKGKMLLGIGAVVGYVLGARAGRDRYNEIKAQVDALWHDPRLQDKFAEANHMVREHAPEVPAKLVDAASAVKAKVQSGPPSDKEATGDVPTTP